MNRVAVIGAGAAGLCVARYMANQPKIFSPVVYEQTDSIGGTWVYSETTDQDTSGLPKHSSMYYNLRTNLPKEVMAFPDFPFPTHWRSYMHHSQVLEYLKMYSAHFGVDDVVRLSTEVTRVHPVSDGDESKVKWEVTTRAVGGQESQTSQFDAVVVCNGHYSEVWQPDIPGLGLFEGMVMHSHYYRHPEIFRDMDVVVVGAGASGWDIALDMANNARNIYLSHNKTLFPAKLPQKIVQVPKISEITKTDRVLFEGGYERQADAILFCTGYKYTFPFLSPQCHVELDAQGKRINSLYLHMFHIPNPSLVFVGIPSIVCPFPLMSLQARAVAAVLSSQVELPSRDVMEDEISRETLTRENAGWPPHYAHRFAEKQWEYNSSIAKLAGCNDLPPVVRSLYEFSWKMRALNTGGYRKEEFCIVDSNTWAHADKSKQIPVTNF